MAVEPVDVVAYTLAIELPSTASFDSVTLDHTTSSPTSQFTTSWPTTITDNATDYQALPFSQSPPEHALCIPLIFTYTGPIDSLRQASHPSHLLLHNLHHSIHTLLRRRLPRLLHVLLNFGPTLRPVTRRPPQLHLRTHSHIKDSLLDQPVQPGV